MQWANHATTTFLTTTNGGSYANVKRMYYERERGQLCHYAALEDAVGDNYPEGVLLTNCIHPRVFVYLLL